MEGSEEHAAEHEGSHHLFCSGGCRESFLNDPEHYLGMQRPPGDGQVDASAPTRRGLLTLRTWYEITEKFVGDVKMLRNELAVGYLIAGFAEALVPHP